MDYEEREEMCKEVSDDLGERYISIPTRFSDEGYEDMQDFIETIEDANLREKLYITINGRGAFRRFKNILMRHPQERERWFKLKNARIMERVKEWLEVEGIEITKAQSIEIKETHPRDLYGSKEIDEPWSDFGSTACLRCGNEEEFEERYFILSRCPEKTEEEEWLDETMIKQYGLEHYGVIDGALDDNRGLIVSAVCKRCGSQDVFYDF